MNEFEKSLREFNEESIKIKKEAAELQLHQQLFNEKLHSFLKQNGLPDNFTLPEMAILAVEKSKSKLVTL